MQIYFRFLLPVLLFNCNQFERKYELYVLKCSIGTWQINSCKYHNVTLLFTSSLSAWLLGNANNMIWLIFSFVRVRARFDGGPRARRINQRLGLFKVYFGNLFCPPVRVRVTAFINKIVSLINNDIGTTFIHSYSLGRFMRRYWGAGTHMSTTFMRGNWNTSCSGFLLRARCRIDL